MPQRTNERQQIIELLKTMAAAPNCTVTPSKFLTDAVTEEQREVDVVAEYRIDGGDTMVQSFEVTAAERPADVTWVEQTIAKHEHLPTNQLVLVSWSGFTKPAMRKAATNPRVLLGTPEVITESGEPRLRTVYVGRVLVTLQRTRLQIRLPDGSLGMVVSDPGLRIFSEIGGLPGTTGLLTDWLLKNPSIHQDLVNRVVSHPEREELKSFVLGVPIEQLPIALYQEQLDEYHQITIVEMSGDVSFEQQALEMEIRRFREQTFAHGSTLLGGAEALFVAALDESLGISQLIARFTTPPSTAAPLPRAQEG